MLRRHLLFVAWSLVLASPAAAQSLAAQAIIAAEFAFAADARTRGLKPAFLASMHDSAVYFPAGAPVSARAYWSGRPEPAPTDPVLRWAPALAGVSAAGDLGYTTGPWQMAGADSKLIATGQFFTVWARQSDGSWRWLLDNGISSPLSTTPAALPTATLATPNKVPGGTGAQPLNVRWLDEQLSANIAKRTMKLAYNEQLHPQARLLREGLAPLTTKAAIAEQLYNEAPQRLQPASGRVAASRDLAYSYGTCQVAKTGAASGSYVHLWKRSREAGWQLLLEITNPAPSAEPTTEPVGDK